MDMSFLLKSMLPPGVTVEALQATAIDVAQRVVVAAQQIGQMHHMMVEQDAMMRQILANGQAQPDNPPNFHQEPNHDHDQHASAFPAIELAGPDSGLSSATNAGPGGSPYPGNYGSDSSPDRDGPG